jgi:hypothetical protein
VIRNLSLWVFLILISNHSVTEALATPVDATQCLVGYGRV